MKNENIKNVKNAKCALGEAMGNNCQVLSIA